MTVFISKLTGLMQRIASARRFGVIDYGYTNIFDLIGFMLADRKPPAKSSTHGKSPQSDEVMLLEVNIWK